MKHQVGRYAEVKVRPEYECSMKVCITKVIVMLRIVILR